jgi:hypothetical protein
MSHIVNTLNKRQEIGVRRSEGVCDIFGQTLSQAVSHHMTLSNMKAVYLMKYSEPFPLNQSCDPQPHESWTLRYSPLTHMYYDKMTHAVISELSRNPYISSLLFSYQPIG